jgi:hypothetical protein
MRPPATPTLRADDDKVRVTEWRIMPGEATGYHTHEMDYVIVPLVEGVVTIQAPDGSMSDHVMSPSAPYSRKAGVQHDVINNTKSPILFVEVELKP